MRAPSYGREDDKLRERPDGLCGTVLLGRVMLIAAYLALNISLNMINKWTLTGYGFRFPIALSMAHQAFTLMALTPFMLTRGHLGEHSAVVQKQWPGLLGIAAFFSFNLGCNNISLLSISLSLNQVIRACIPVATALGATVIENKPPTKQEFISLLVLVSGVGIAIWEGGSTRATVTGIMLCVLGTLSNGFMMSSIGRLLSDKLDVWRLTWYLAPITIVMLLPFYWWLEAAELAKYRQKEGMQYTMLVALGCVNALLYNVVHSLVIKVTSSVTTTVLGEMKIIFILILSSLWLGESDIYTAKMLLGVTVAMLGFIMFSHAKLAAPPSGYSALPVIKGVPELPPSLQDSARASPLQKDGSSGFGGSSGGKQAQR